MGVGGRGVSHAGCCRCVLVLETCWPLATQHPSGVMRSVMWKSATAHISMAGVQVTTSSGITTCVRVCLSRAAAAGADLELQPNASAPLLRNSKARREWIEQEMELCSTSWQYQKVGMMSGLCLLQALTATHTFVDTLHAGRLPHRTADSDTQLAVCFATCWPSAYGLHRRSVCSSSVCRCAAPPFHTRHLLLCTGA